jgi:hypothetical protein
MEWAGIGRRVIGIILCTITSNVGCLFVFSFLNFALDWLKITER